MDVELGDKASIYQKRSLIRGVQVVENASGDRIPSSYTNESKNHWSLKKGKMNLLWTLPQFSGTLFGDVQLQGLFHM